MPRYPKERPARLTEKLYQIRTLLGLSQNGMLEKLGLSETRARSSVSYYERGGDPPLGVLLQYARIAGVSVEELIDDELDLPRSLPATPRHYLHRRAASQKIKGKHAG